MSGAVQGVPGDSSVVIPRLVCRDPAAAVAFCARVLGAVELNRRPGPDGTVAHALMTIGPAMIMIEGEWPTLPSRAPKADGSSPVVIFVYVPDVDRTVERAMAAGGGGSWFLCRISSGATGSRGSWTHPGTYGPLPHGSKTRRPKSERIDGRRF
jgi:PhnB protein